MPDPETTSFMKLIKNDWGKVLLRSEKLKERNDELETKMDSLYILFEEIKNEQEKSNRKKSNRKSARLSGRQTVIKR